MGLDQAFDYCGKLAKSHYENFSVTNLWLPAEVRPHFASIYAYCRWSDDLADETGDRNRSSELLQWWKHELHRAVDGKSMHPVFVALHHTIDSFSLDIEPFEDLLSAFVQDQSVSSYQDDEQLLDYCRRSANPVGRLILGLARSSDSRSKAWSDSICTGLQIANFCQDVRIDAIRERYYLPGSRMQKAGITQQDWKDGTTLAREALADWVAYAREHFDAGQPLTKHGANWLRRSVQLFLGGGKQILQNIQRIQYDVWSNSPEVSKLQKARLVVNALLASRHLPVSRDLLTKP
jgi:squalene synthase HpnC